MKRISICFSLIAALSAFSGCSEVNQQAKPKAIVNTTKISQQQLDLLAETLVVKYRFLSNIETDCPNLEGKKVQHCYAAEVLLTSPTDVSVNNWSINFSQVYPAYASFSEQLNLKHLNGDIHQITPKKEFKGFIAEQTVKVKLWVKSTLINEAELMPNYWLAANGLTPRVINSTRTTIDSETWLEQQPYVVSFDDLPKQIKLSPEDVNTFASPAQLYRDYGDITIQKPRVSNTIIPTPKFASFTQPNKSLDLRRGLTPQLNNVAPKMLAAAFERLALLGVEVSEEGVALTINVDSRLAYQLGGYELVISEDNIAINASDETGAFYGLQSIASLLDLNSPSLPVGKVFDEPRYQYRGQHIDVARNFHSKEMVLGLIKQMAAYKLNKLHLHLAEDEAWRLELPSLPELTAVGASRCMKLTDETCMQPQLGGAGASERDGYFSVSDYQQILREATRHHIQVIPSLDMPGHSRAAIKAMEARYRYYAQQEQMDKAEQYLLTDFNDKTQYSSIQNYNDNTINICMESSYQFVDRVLEDLIAIHQGAEHPLAMYHIGADETAGAWVDSPVCQALIADKSNDVNDVKHLGAHFIERVSNMVAAKGIAVGGWNDGLGETDTHRMPKDVYSYIWGALPWGAHKQVSEQARRNWQVVLSIPDVFYFDFPYEIDPKERGYHWASRRVNSRSIFNFMPDNLPVHAEFRVDTSGKPFVSDDTKQVDDSGKTLHLPLPQDYVVAGIQGQLWSETVRSDAQAEYMMFPRIIAFAERAWHKPNWEVPYNFQGAKYDRTTGIFTTERQKSRDQQWQQFSAALTLKELPKLEKSGVFYRLPTVGAVIEDGLLKANTSLLGLPIEYQEQDGQWQTYQQPVKVATPVKVRARTFDGERAGRSLVVH